MADATLRLCARSRRRTLVRDATRRRRPAVPERHRLPGGRSRRTSACCDVHFVHPLPGQPGGVPAGDPLAASNFAVEGGVRISGIRVQTVVATAGRSSTLRVDQAGDFSPYALRLVASPLDDVPPTGFDPALSYVTFSFKVHCAATPTAVARHECPPRAGSGAAPELSREGLRELPPAAARSPRRHSARLARPQPRRPRRDARRSCSRTSATSSATTRTRWRPRRTSARRGAGRRCAGTRGSSTTPARRRERPRLAGLRDRRRSRHRRGAATARGHARDRRRHGDRRGRRRRRRSRPCTR